MKQLLVPFKEVLEHRLPDFNTARVTNSDAKSRQWIFPVRPESYKSLFPILSLKLENPSQDYVIEDEDAYHIYYSADLIISFWTKKGLDFSCDDNLDRKNYAFTEYYITTFLWPTLNIFRSEITESGVIETYNIIDSIRDEYTKEDWLIGQSFTIKIRGHLTRKIPSNDGIINEIRYSTTINTE